MSAPKCRVKQQKMARKRQRKEAARQRRERNRGWSDSDSFESDVFFGPLGGVKMSKVLEIFVEPYADGVKDLDDYRNLLGFGQCAWNAALRDEWERGKMIDEFVAGRISMFNPKGRAAAREFLNSLTARKLEHFAQFLRPILAFDVRDVCDGWHLNVMSAVV